MTPLEAAIASELPCFPGQWHTEAASIPGLGHYKDSTAHQDAPRRLWRRNPGRLVGVATCEISGLYVLDIDSVKHPEAAGWLAENRQRLPLTREHRTWSGGLHLVLQHAPGVRISTSRFALGVDALAEYAATPSRNSSATLARVAGPFNQVCSFAGFDSLTGGALDIIEFLRRGDYLNRHTAFVQLANVLTAAFDAMAAVLSKETLCPDGENTNLLHDTLESQSHIFTHGVPSGAASVRTISSRGAILEKAAAIARFATASRS